MKQCVLIVLAALTGSVLFAGHALAENTFTYQGRLDSAGQPFSGTVNMEFRLFAGNTGGTPLADQTSNNVTVMDGLFKADLDFGVQSYESGLWLEVVVNDQVLSPRQRISAAPFATRSSFSTTSANSQQLGGRPPSDFMVRGPGDGQMGGSNMWRHYFITLGQPGSYPMGQTTFQTFGSGFRICNNITSERGYIIYVNGVRNAGTFTNCTPTFNPGFNGDFQVYSRRLFLVGVPSGDTGGQSSYVIQGFSHLF